MTSGRRYSRGSHDSRTLDSVTVRIELTADARRRLEAEAARRGITVDELVADLAASLPGESDDQEQPALTFLAAGASKAGITHRIDELLADRFGRS